MIIIVVAHANDFAAVVPTCFYGWGEVGQEQLCIYLACGIIIVQQ